ncbi:protein unc-119 homolog B-like isoform X2 [Cyprinus carpio]|uniref:Protein unc-119 homolog B-like isoform X2 n=1 Tax=Cyprinus carpio TaxID=7962 RepID=A0A9Q9W3K1_CYPCA|nr:protein unc-119 homolog B-like isoform X2 [Cyprinus carpio]
MDSEGVKELQSEEDMEQEVSSDKDEDSEPEEEDEAEEDEEEMAEMQDRGDLRDVEVWNGFISGAGLAAEEEALLDWTPGDPVTPQYVLRLPGYTDDYLCSPEDNIYNISFSRFKIRDLEGGLVILDLKRQCPTEIKDVIELDAGRFIQYHFSPAFLSLREIGATRNTCEHIYCLPDLDSHTIEEMINHPFETRSDSFYFANNTLIMHHKAEYSFS